ncbi:hypothetical protein [Bradyrhizobium sp. 5.13L]
MNMPQGDRSRGNPRAAPGDDAGFTGIAAAEGSLVIALGASGCVLTVAGDGSGVWAETGAVDAANVTANTKTVSRAAGALPLEGLPSGCIIIPFRSGSSVRA